jgi:hypothetical protein
MPLTQFIAIVSETNQVSAAELEKVAGALDKQAQRDLADPWGIIASVNPYSSLDDVPTDYWPVIIRDDIGYSGAAGVHLDKEGQPFALVQYDPDWSLTASHEVLEMMVDPFGNRLVAGKSPKKGQGRVNFLVEVCDPSEDAKFGYTVNGVLVADFYFESFFDPVTSSGTRYSYSGAIQKPRDVLKGGYLSWMVPETGEWFQKIFFGTKPKYQSLGVFDAAKFTCLREFVDHNTSKPLQQRRGAARRTLTAAAEFSIPAQVDAATAGRAGRLRSQIKALLKKA